MCGLALTQAHFSNFIDKPKFDRIGVVKEDSFADLVNNTHTHTHTHTHIYIYIYICCYVRQSEEHQIF